MFQSLGEHVGSEFETAMIMNRSISMKLENHSDVRVFERDHHHPEKVFSGLFEEVEMPLKSERMSSFFQKNSKGHKKVHQLVKMMEADVGRHLSRVKVCLTVLFLLQSEQLRQGPSVTGLW